MTASINRSFGGILFYKAPLLGYTDIFVSLHLQNE